MARKERMQNIYTHWERKTKKLILDIFFSFSQFNFKKMHSRFETILLVVLLVLRNTPLTVAFQPALYTCFDSACSNCTVAQNISSTCVNDTIPFPIKLGYSSFQPFCVLPPSGSPQLNFYSESACKSLIYISFSATACIYDSAAAIDVSISCSKVSTSVLDSAVKANTDCKGNLVNVIAPTFTSETCAAANPGDFVYYPIHGYSVDCQSETLYWYQDFACSSYPGNSNTIPLPTCLPGNGGLYYSVKCSASQKFVPGNNDPTNSTTGSPSNSTTGSPSQQPSSSPSQPSSSFRSKTWFSIFSIFSVLSFIWF